MSLVSRISLYGPATQDPEDYLSSSLGVIFPDDVTNQHGDAEHSLLYTSPHLPRPLHILLSDPDRDDDRKLFSHYLWNSSLLLAEFVEAGTLGLDDVDAGTGIGLGKLTPRAFNIAGLETLELGAGTALPSILAALLGASHVAVTDYPSDAVLSMLRANTTSNIQPQNLPPPRTTPSPYTIAGHAWGELTNTPFARQNQGRYDRVFVCDCLWMPWQHANLQKSTSHFLKDAPDARAWVVAGLHTGRAKMRGFFDAAALRGVGLEVESIWERDCDGVERAWVGDRGHEDVSERKRWLVVGVLRRVNLRQASSDEVVGE